MTNRKKEISASIFIDVKKGTYVRVIPLVSTPDAVPGFTDKTPKPPPPYRVGHWLEGYLMEDIGLTGQICFGSPSLERQGGQGILAEFSDLPGRWRSDLLPEGDLSNFEGPRLRS